MCPTLAGQSGRCPGVECYDLFGVGSWNPDLQPWTLVWFRIRHERRQKRFEVSDPGRLKTEDDTSSSGSASSIVFGGEMTSAGLHDDEALALAVDRRSAREGGS